MAGGMAGVRNSRSKERSSSTGGESTLDPLRKASMERRKRERENIKKQEEDAFRAIVRDCKTADIATNVHFIQMRIDQGKIRENQQDVALAMAAMKLQMEQLLAMGKQAKVLVENLKNGEVTLNDTRGLQDSIQGLNQQMREGFLVDLHLEGKRIENSIENSIISKINAISSPPPKRPRKISTGRQQVAADDIQIIVTDTEMEVDEVASGPLPGPGLTGPAPTSKVTKKLISPAMQRASDYNQGNRDGQIYANKAASKPSGGQPAGQQRKQAPAIRDGEGRAAATGTVTITTATTSEGIETGVDPTTTTVGIETGVGLDT
jgi:hypothetical protein